MEINFNRSQDEDRVFAFLSSNEKAFVPPLDGRCNVYERAKKLADKAINIFIIDSASDVDLGHAALYLINENMAYITSFCIDQKYQQKKLGSALLNEVFAACQDFGISNIKLEVFKKNSRAHEFYLKHGFADIEGSNDKLTMLKILI